MTRVVGSGRYEILGRVGSGGEGTVYRARDTKRARLVAVKTRPAEPGIDRQTRLLYELPPHPALPSVRDDFIEDDVHHLVTDWVAGRSLETLVLNGERPDLIEVLRILRPVADALEALHQHGLVHSDVKPANILVAQTGGVLVDLGSTMHLTRNRFTPTIGTRGYRAPELAVDVTAGAATDVYGLAATIIALLTGGPPSPGPFPDLPTVPGGERQHVRAALEKALSIDPAQRPSSPSGLLSLLDSLATGDHNLPQVLTSFVGRSGDRERVSRLIRSEPLVTITGPPGVGKTRLAIEVARGLGGWFPGGIRFVDLTQVRTSAQLIERVASRLGVRPRARRDLTTAIALKLSRVASLLILDNCEQIREPVTDFTRALLDGETRIRIVVTSRAPLQSTLERLVEIAPLAIPADEGIDDHESPEAVRLFTDRVLAWSASGSVLDHIGELVPGLVRRLDGLPLAIELAAAAAGRGGDVKTLLDGGANGGALQPLDAAIAWSYELLTTPLRIVLEAAAVFAGQFDAAALAAVLDDDPADVRTRLHELVAHSIVSRAGDERFRLLETVRDYARRQLAASGHEPPTLLAYADYFSSLARRVGKDVGRLHRTREALDTLDDRRDDVHRMIDVLREAGRTQDAMLSAAPLTDFWLVRGHWHEAWRTLETLLQSTGGTPDSRREIEASAGRVAWTLGDVDRAETLYRSVIAASGADPDDLTSIAEAMLGAIALRRGMPEDAERHIATATEIAVRLGNQRRIAQSLTAQGLLLDTRGDYAGAARLFERALGLWRRIGDDHMAAIATNNFAVELMVLGDLATAEQLHREALALRRSIGDPQGVAGSLSGVGECAVNRGNFSEAVRHFTEALAIRRDLGDVREAAVEVANLADASLAQLDVTRAESRYREALEMIHAVPDRPTELLIRRGLGWTLWAAGEFNRAEGLLETVAHEAAAAGVAEEEVSARHAIARVVLDRDGRVPHARAITAAMLRQRLSAARLLRVLNAVETAAAVLGDTPAGRDALTAATRTRIERGMPRRPVHAAFVMRHLPDFADVTGDSATDVESAAHAALAALESDP